MPTFLQIITSSEFEVVVQVVLIYAKSAVVDVKSSEFYIIMERPAVTPREPATVASFACLHRAVLDGLSALRCTSQDEPTAA